MGLMAAAQESVLSTPELLNHILLQLPVRDLLLAQAVCPSWKDIITTSPPLQKALFFLGAPNRTSPQHNPLLAESFPLWFKDQETPRGPYSNTVLTSNQEEDFHSLAFAKSKEKTEAYMRADASWRKMLVVQPPVQDLLIEDYHDDFCGPSKVSADVKFEDGLRMGAVFDITSRYVMSRSSSFGVQWCMFPPDVRKWEELFEERERTGVSGRAGLSADLTVMEIREELERFGMREVRNSATLVLATFHGCCPNRGDFKSVHDFTSQGYEEVEIKFGESTSISRSWHWPNFLEG